MTDTWEHKDPYRLGEPYDASQRPRWIRQADARTAEQQARYEAIIKLRDAIPPMPTSRPAPPTYVCDQVTRMANGSLLILARDGTRMVVPPAYLKDLVALAELTMLDAVVGDGEGSGAGEASGTSA